MILQAVIVIAVAAVASFGVLVVGNGSFAAKRLPRFAEGWSGLALTVCLLVSAAAVAGPPRWPPAPRWHCTVHVVLVLCCTATALLAMGPVTGVRIGVWALLTGGICGWLVDLPEAGGAPWRGTLAAAVCAQTLGLILGTRRRPASGAGRDLAIGLWTAVLLFAAARFFQMATIIAAPALLVSVAPGATRARTAGGVAFGAGGVLAALFPTLALIGYVYNSGSASPLGWGLLACWPAVATLASWKSGSDYAVSGPVRTLLLAGACAVVLGLSDMVETWEYIIEQAR